MKHLSVLLITALAASACNTSHSQHGGFEVDFDKRTGALTITHMERGDILADLRFGAGTGSYQLDQAFGSYRFDDVEHSIDWASGVANFAPFNVDDTIELAGHHDDVLGLLVLEPIGEDMLRLYFEPNDDSSDRTVLQAACDDDDHFLGLGGHAMDVDHVGQAFPIWVSEPGVGKDDEDDYPDDWSITGTRHASSYPMPFLLRPHQTHGLLLEGHARTEVDLCASDPSRFSMLTWGAPMEIILISGDDPLHVLEHASERWGRIQQPPAWGLGAWVDAVGGSDRVREVAAAVRQAGAAVSVIWTEDWKGFELQGTGYRLGYEWFVDREHYPDAETIDEELEAAGLKWLAYFSAFVAEETVTWDSAQDAGVLIQDDQGEPYTFLGVSLKWISLVDYTHPDAQDWSVAWMQACLDVGFDGWMADYGEWLPTDSVLYDGDPMLEHNRYPERWQATNLAAIDGRDATFFSRSGWAGAQGLSPVVWGGDQRTSFDMDDGFPTVLALGLGLSASGVPVYTHDIAGYNSVGNDPSDKELWFRWAGLGAYTPVMRTHHGAFDEENHQFDRDEETLAYYAATTQEHTRLYPYRSGLARQAAERGSPMIRPVAFHYGEDWGRMDAWLLGPALLVAPVMERGAMGREVELPVDVAWYDWHSLEAASGGWVDAATDRTPVFAAAGTTVPTFGTIPDTLAEAEGDGVLDFDDADGERIVYLFGGGGEFTEGDGTRYTPSGTPTGSGETTDTLTNGSITVAGVTLDIEGEAERSYTVVVVD